MSCRSEVPCRPHGAAVKLLAGLAPLGCPEDSASWPLAPRGAHCRGVPGPPHPPRSAHLPLTLLPPAFVFQAPGPCLRSLMGNPHPSASCNLRESQVLEIGIWMIWGVLPCRPRGVTSCDAVWVSAKTGTSRGFAKAAGVASQERRRQGLPGQAFNSLLKIPPVTRLLLNLQESHALRWMRPVYLCLGPRLNL